MAKQLGFYFDSGRCVQCHACEVACRSVHDVGLGLRWRRLTDRWYGEFPDTANITLSSSCYHCERPSCLSACPTHAIQKRAEDGVVIVDREECIGCQACATACPYGAPQFGADGRMQKCTFCLGRTKKGLEPACVSTCPGEALKFGEIDALLVQSASKNGERLVGPNKPAAVLVQASNLAGVKADFREFFEHPNKTTSRNR